MSERPHALLVDDDRELCELLSMRLEHHGYRVTVATTARAGLDALSRGRVDVMVLDLRLGDDDGLDVLARVQERSPDVPVVMLTAHGTVETAVRAMERGAYGFLTKPFHDHELLQKLGHAVERRALRSEVAGLRRMLGDAPDHARLLGVSAPIARVRELIERVAPTDATVLVQGESGTGKELAARALHALSPRAKGPFVAVNCGALPPELLESVLFGHVKGAFTGATSDREGLFGAARGGTLFLDEVGEATTAVQVKLLRALQERRYTRVGATAEEETDARVVAASNRDLRAAVQEGRFREDLFYRLHVVPLGMPALRERMEDVPLLAEVFLERAAARHRVPVPRLAPDAVAALRAHAWPGNVRELANVMEAALLMARSKELRAEDVTPLLQPGARRSVAVVETGLEKAAELPTLKEARDAFEREYLVEALRRAGGNVSAAARAAGRNRSDFYELLRRHGLSPGDFKGG